MPIRGLTEQKRLPRVLKIHLGEPPIEGKNYPSKTDHFVVHADDPLASLFHELYGAEPKELRIIFPPASEPGKTEAECCANQYYYAYGSGTGRVCKGDGYKAEALLDVAQMKKSGGEVQLACWATSKSEQVEWRTIDCPGAGYEGKPPCPMFATKRCKRLMMLQFLLDGLPPDGICQIDTSSINSIRNINDTLNMVEGFTGGRISLIPMRLQLVPKDVQHDGKKVRIYALQLRTDWQLVQLIDAAEKPRNQFLLPAADDEKPEDLFVEEEEEEEATPVEGEVISPGESEPPLIEEEIVPPSPRQEKPRPMPPQGQPMASDPRQPALGNGWATVWARAQELDYTEAQTLELLNLETPADFERRQLLAKNCVRMLEANADAAKKRGVTLQKAIDQVTAHRGAHNGRTYGE